MAEGKGTGVSLDKARVRVNQSRFPVDVGDTMTDLRSPVEFRKIGRPIAQGLMDRCQDQGSLMHLAGARGFHNNIEWASAAAHRSKPVELVTREWLDRHHPDWPVRFDCDAVHAIQTEGALRLVPAPREAGVLTLEAYRLPLKPLANDSDKPENHAASHPYLVYWALHRAFSQPDSDGFDPQRAATAEAAGPMLICVAPLATMFPR